MSEKLRQINLHEEDRWLSILAGSLILLVTLRPRGAWGVLFALVGGELIYRGLTGRSYVHTMLEFKAPPDPSQLSSVADNGKVEVESQKDQVQVASEGSFPASDPPSFTATTL